MDLHHWKKIRALAVRQTKGITEERKVLRRLLREYDREDKLCIAIEEALHKISDLEIDFWLSIHKAEREQAEKKKV